MRVSAEELSEIRHGRSIKTLRTKSTAADAVLPAADQLAAEWAAVDETGNLVAILREKHRGQLWPKHNFES
jgi:hypothetical protein